MPKGEELGGMPGAALTEAVSARPDDARAGRDARSELVADRARLALKLATRPLRSVAIVVALWPVGTITRVT